ncbi:hypothetical protein H5410_030706 [Solanum commersonii]|uniref:NADH:quinone oxidoreductase/Mrp antiporter membrane subunit domain-containing protein n=1 Tax=Solanum commersonii TaxID=4109 RepID=A0A9J5YI80_SOLCO|nr:hypothetical protein H5410_030706 [Solanum commersonii]
MIDSTSYQNDITWLYFICSTRLVMRITALLFQWREELMIKYIEYIESAIIEFLLFVLTSTLGGMFLCGANDLITIFVSPKCFSLCSYLLSGYNNKDLRSNEATMKYLLMGRASSFVLVHGFSWLYGSSEEEIEYQEIVNGLINTQMYNSEGISIALIITTVGIRLKPSPFPSYQWTPDVYERVWFVQEFLPLYL